MKKLIGVFGFIILVDGAGNSAQAAPWCLFYDQSTYNCGFHTYAQCLASRSGAGGYCRPNPFEGGGSGQYRRRRDY